IGLSERIFFSGPSRASTTGFVKYSRYVPLPKNFYYSFGLEGQSRLAPQLAYADNIALGYRSYIRGYELYVIGGQHFGLFKQGLSRQLIDLNQVKINFIRNPKFNRIPVTLYLNAFADAAYTVDNVYRQTNDFTNRLLLAAGLGLHVVTYYDRVITLEFSVNREGRTGLYLHTAFPF
ncbi:MAG TPA: hypothetical protein VK927_08540, partial [Adhaeribacter sp.]|nr:hypothetical protein [Adhaeribacter sp.]